MYVTVWRGSEGNITLALFSLSYNHRLASFPSFICVYLLIHTQTYQKSTKNKVVHFLISQAGTVRGV